jgi:asparagine synthase (glutamine-hydrolysing)
MCGIAGMFGRSDAAVIRSMLATIAHRGPDDQHEVCGPDFSLGVRRLAIIDPANGRQPLSNEDGSVWACQNGELYNFPEQRPCLERKGHVFLTRCDTEILPHLYEDHGTAFAEHVQGMFAVALWDARRKTGVLMRDRMGKKPLYYAQVDGALYFASELKALLGAPGLERRLNLEAVHHFLSYKHVPNPLTIFEGIYMLPPAHLLTYVPGEPHRIQRYWRPDFSEQPESAAMSDQDIADRLLVLLRQGIKRRLMSDVPIGFFLSGGIDSSLSTALAAEQAGGRIKTFTLTYGDTSTTAGKDADRRWARYVAERFGTDHHEEVVDFGTFPDTIRPILRAFDEPFAGTVSTYFLAQLMAQHVKVALAGDGADELFGSYRTHRLAEPLAQLPEYMRTGDTALVAPFGSDVTSLERLWEPHDWAWKAKLFVLGDAEKATLYSPDVARKMADWPTTEHLRRSFADLTATDPLNRILEAEFHGLLPDQVLTFVDRLSMAHSLEVRTAFLDTDVVSFVAGISGRRKMVGGETKRLLKQVARRFFPAEMVDRPKEGFIMPVTDWIRAGLEPYVRDTLSPSRLSRHGLFNPVAVQALIDGVYADGGGHTGANKLLVLLTFQEWHDLYLN